LEESGQEDTTRLAARAGPRHLSLAHLWALMCLAVIFVTQNLLVVRPHDFWWHVATGQWIVEHGRVPGVDLYSYTRLAEPYAYGMWWLMQVVLYLLLRAGDLPLVIVFYSLTITAAYGLLLLANRRAAGGNLRWASLATLAAAVVGLNNWNVRPQILSILLFALTLYLLERYASAPVNKRAIGALWALPPLFALWANGHAGFAYGLLLLGTTALAESVAWLRRRRAFPGRLWLVTGLSAAATLLTPLGPELLGNLIAIGRHPIMGQVQEWMPLTLRTPTGQVLFGFLAILVALLLISRHRPAPAESLRLLLFGGLALAAVRNTIWLGMVAAPVLAASLRSWELQRGGSGLPRAGRPVVNAAMAALVGLVAALSLPWLRPYLPLPPERKAYLSAETPVEAVAFLRTLSRPGQVFHSDVFGSYMIWASPEVPVFIDPRIDLYPVEQWNDYIAVCLARYDWEAILARYQVDTLFLESEGMPWLVEAASASPNWERVYEDDQAVILRRRGGP